MADIFVTYASEDRKRVEPLVDLLKQQGWSVWWDRDLIAGPSFDREIEKALHEARCVVVVWSRHSIESTWCRAEATDAQERAIMVPVIVDDIRPPLAFRAAQTASLIGWPRSQDNIGKVFEGVSVCLGAPRQTPSEATRESRRPPRVIAVVTCAIALVVMVLWVVIDAQSPADGLVTTNHSVVRIAVLPFQDFSATNDNVHLAAGFQEDIISKLAQIDDLGVTSRSSTRRYQQASERSIPEIARELSVSHVLEGSIRRSANQVRVSIQLIEADTDRQLWAESYDRDLTNIFAIQTDVARDVAFQLEKEFSTQEVARLSNSPTDDLQAYELVLAARELLKVGTAKSLAQAADLTRQAVVRDPELAEAHASLARALFLQTFLNTSWPDVRTEVLQASARALELDPASADIHTNHAHIISVWENEVESALMHYQKAIDLEPNNSFSLLHYGAHLSENEGKAGAGLPLLQRAIALDPMSGEISFYLSNALASLGRYEEAAEVGLRGLKFNPDDLNLRSSEVFYLTAIGDLNTAFDRLNELAILDPMHLQTLGTIAYYLSYLGELEAAQLWVDRMHALSPMHPDYFELQSAVYARIGDIDGLKKLLGRWQTLNTSDRAERDFAGLSSSFATQCQLRILELQANNARTNGEHDAEVLLRQSAVEIAPQILTDDEGNLIVKWVNQLFAVVHAQHLLLLGRKQDAVSILEAILQSGDPADGSQLSNLLITRAMLDDRRDTLNFIRGKANLLNDRSILDAIRNNRLALYGDLPSEPEFKAFLDAAIASNEALRAYLSAELPSLLTATTGL